jgi:predicted house-cleaning noncanonical NTP pyrophosphatase (MazG superfamily)
MNYIFHLEKLVRDRIPELMAKPGNVLEVLTLDHKDHILALKKKLKEEAEEVHKATTRDEVIEEIADVAEV